MEKALKFTQTDPSILDLLNIMKDVEMEAIFPQMEMSIKENSKMVSPMEKEFFIKIMEQYSKVISKMEP
eukprot:CAMPEP_0202950246 /NCGR_PEP_ID=MMETSP1395-20130829/20540_1 /ASSEMBLY_ACC=CAM_ASM_000871 /TAXON_ID=5961 /ORGANISM="Blepharisma japonicum, Strain Stock R1072" /LENGTH=68 /DNA_ID=CAMNT_0049654341 /DNA_START=314 /DNA_END=520 /DNA_ORIENTATION=+